jgi:hypothetical protein
MSPVKNHGAFEMWHLTILNYRKKYAISDFCYILMGKGQNVENHFIESQKKNIESLKVDQKFEKDQNVKIIY